LWQVLINWLQKLAAKPTIGDITNYGRAMGIRRYSSNLRIFIHQASMVDSISNTNKIKWKQ